MSQRAVILTTHSMDEAEALCKRIGIMVHGQVRALGTKQHLKNKFGSGFELVVKLIISSTTKENELTQHVQEMTNFVSNMFASSVLISDNGGLLTYTIPREEMKMGLAFSRLEASKTALRIEDYSVAQPTLEQVFIRNVNKYSENKEDGMRSSRMEAATTGAEGTQAVEQVYQEINKCGCSKTTTQIMTVIASVIFVVLWLIAIFVFRKSNRSDSSVLFLLGIISLIVACVGCNLLCCACCKPATGADR